MKLAPLSTSFQVLYRVLQSKRCNLVRDDEFGIKRDVISMLLIVVDVSLVSRHQAIAIANGSSANKYSAFVIPLGDLQAYSTTVNRNNIFNLAQFVHYLILTTLSVFFAHSIESIEDFDITVATVVGLGWCFHTLQKRIKDC